jgi:hypothetical protein
LTLTFKVARFSAPTSTEKAMGGFVSVFGSVAIFHLINGNSSGLD